MKAILEYEIPEEETEFNFAIHAIQFESWLDDINEVLRKTEKYDLEENMAIEQIRSIIDEYLLLRETF